MNTIEALGTLIADLYRQITSLQQDNIKLSEHNTHLENALRQVAESQASEGANS